MAAQAVYVYHVDEVTGKALLLVRDVVPDPEELKYEELCYLYAQFPLQDHREVTRTYISRETAEKLISGLQRYVDSFRPKEGKPE